MIPVAIELAGEQRTGNWIAKEVVPKLDGLDRNSAMFASFFIIAVILAVGVGPGLVGDLPGPWWMELIIVAVAGGGGGVVLSAVSLMFIHLLPNVADRLKAEESITTLVWIGAFALLVAFGCQMAAVWLA